MLKGHSVGVVVPAYNEEALIRRTLVTIPEFVDRIIVVNDGSRDKTGNVVRDVMQTDSRIVLINHEKNRGLGQALITGYLKAAELGVEITSIMAGDAQMSPQDLETVATPIALGQVDYVKGNRLLHEKVIERMPTHRFLGNGALTLLTKFATGYWHSMDPQCGYTAIGLEALRNIPIENMIKGYGYNAHILHMLNLENFVVKDVEIEPVYGDEKSKIKLYKYIPTVSWLLIRLFFRRLLRKYLLRDFHPLIFFYGFSFFLLFAACPLLLVRLVWLFIDQNVMPTTTLSIFSFAFTIGFLSLFFAIWMDMQDNERLWVRMARRPLRTKRTEPIESAGHRERELERV